MTKYQAHSPTSRAAAASMVQSVDNLRREVFRFLFRLGVKGATDEEIIAALGLSPNTGRARRCELYDRGLVADSGHTRATKSGRQAVVWVHYRWRPKETPSRKSMRSIAAMRRRIAELEQEVKTLKARLFAQLG